MKYDNYFRKFRQLILLAPSESGIYVRIQNQHLTTDLHFNTRTGIIHQVCHKITIDENYTYSFTNKEIRMIAEYFDSLLN